MAEELHVTATWRGGLASRASVRSHEVIADEPESVGGGDSGPMPTELFCASLATCFCLAVAHVAAKRDRELEGLQVEVDAARIGRELRYGRLRVEVAAHAPQEDLAALIERAKPFCWVSNMISDEVETQYVARSLDHGAG